MAKHFIQRVVIDIHDDDRPNAILLQNDMSALFRSKLQARLEAILNEFERKGEIIRIDALSIDLGTLQRQHLERDALRRFDDALRNALRNAIGTPKTPLPAAAQTHTPTQHHLQTLAYYLTHGRLPADSPQHIEINALLLQAIQTQSQLVRQQLQPLLRDRNAVYRLGYTLQRDTQSALLRLLAPQTHDRLMLGLNNVLRIYGFAAGSTAQRQLQQRVFFAYFSALQQSLLTRQSLLLTDQDLQTALQPLLPDTWQPVAQRLFSPEFSGQNPNIPNATTLATQSQSAIIDALQDPEIRYQLLEDAPTHTLDPILQKLAGSKTKALKKRLKTLLASWNIPSAYRPQLETHAWSLTLLYLADRTHLAKLKLSELEQHLTESLTQFSHFVRWRNDQKPPATDWTAVTRPDATFPDLTALQQALQHTVRPTRSAQAFARWSQQLTSLQQALAAQLLTIAGIAPDGSQPFGEWLLAQQRRWTTAMQRPLPRPDTPDAASDTPKAEAMSPTHAQDTSQLPFGESWWAALDKQAAAFAERPPQSLTKALQPLNDYLAQWLNPATATPTPDQIARAHTFTRTLSQTWTRLAGIAQAINATAIKAAIQAVQKALHTASNTPPETPPDWKPVHQALAQLRHQLSQSTESGQWLASLATLTESIEQVLATWSRRATVEGTPHLAASRPFPTWELPTEQAEQATFAERPKEALTAAITPLIDRLTQWLSPPAGTTTTEVAHALTQSMAQTWAQLIPLSYAASPPAIQTTLKALGAALQTAVATPRNSIPDLAPVRDWLATLPLQTREWADGERWFQVLATFAERLEQVIDAWTALSETSADAPLWTAQELLTLIEQAQATVYAQARPWQQSTWAEAIAPLVEALQRQQNTPDTLLHPDNQSILQRASDTVSALLQTLPAPVEEARGVSTTQERALARSALEVIEAFLQRGYVSEQLPDINAVLTYVATHEPERLRNLLQRIGRETAVQQRLKTALQSDTQQLLVELLAPQGVETWTWASQLPQAAYAQWVAAALHSILAFRRMEAPFVAALWMEQQADEAKALAQLQAVAPPDNPLLTPLLQWYDATQAPQEEAFEAWAGDQAQAYLLRGLTHQNWQTTLSEAWLRAGLDHELARPDARERWRKMRLHDQPTQQLDRLVVTLQEGQRNRLLHLFFADTVGFLATLVMALQDQMEDTQAWQAVVRAAFQQPEGQTHTGRLLELSIRHAAQLQRRKTSEVIEALQATTDAHAADSPRFKPLQQLLRHLPQQLTPFADKAAPKPPTAEVSNASQWRSVLDYLRYGQATRPDESVKLLTTWVKSAEAEAIDFWRVSLRRLYRERTRMWQQQLDVDAKLVTALTYQLQPLARRDWNTYLHDLSLHLDNSTLQSAILQRIADLPHWDSAAKLAERVAVTAVQAIAQAQNRSVVAVWEEWEAALRDSNTRSNLAKIAKRQLLQVQRAPNVAAIAPQEVVAPPPTKPVKVDTTIYTEQAGVILLWVFFPHLYTMLELTENRAFKDLPSTLKALYLLYYTATGREQPQEFQLALEKILCALPLDHPVGMGVELTENERAACDQLVQAALNRWQKLKNTTVAGFRASFLTRSGRLTKTAKGWSLTVEQKPFDLLLKSLPWGIAIVRFPWMEEPVYIDWV